MYLYILNASINFDKTWDSFLEFKKVLNVIENQFSNLKKLT